MNQLPLFDSKDTTGPRMITVEYQNSDFNGAIAAAHNTYGERVAVVAIPAGCKLLPSNPLT